MSSSSIMELDQGVMAQAAGGKSILVTGATGSFGQKMVQTLLEHFNPRRLVVFSRDELKQFEMAQTFPPERYPQLRYFIGDIRDGERVRRACHDVDIIVHAAAMKQIVAAEYNPTECIATNVIGAQNLIDAAIENGVSKVVALSTDKAANPINLYGATKLCSDKLFVAANNLSGSVKTRFSIVRYGNVIGSRGSVIPFFKNCIAQGRSVLPITDVDMTRFVITLDQGVAFVLSALVNMTGGEVFVPKLPSIKVVDLVPMISPTNEYEVVGIRPGEKLHEVMIPYEDSRNCYDMGEYYIIAPQHVWWNNSAFAEMVGSSGTPIRNAFEYASGDNDWFLNNAALKILIDSVGAA